MNVLYVTHHYLYMNGGASFATSAIVNAFAELSDSVTLLFPAKDNSQLGKIDKRVKQIPTIDRRNRISKLYNVYIGNIHRFNGVFEEVLSSHDFDLVVFDNCIVSYKLVKIAKEKGKKIITVHHNYQVEIVRDNTPWYTKAPMLYWVGKAEAEAVIGSDINITLTHQDKESLHKHYSENAKIEVLGIFEYARRERPVLQKRISNKDGRYLITGDLSVKQTTDALYPWLNDVFPLLKTATGYKSLTIAGRNPQPKLYKYANDRSISIIASPKEMEPILENADVYICSTGLGSGIKLRIMDGLKAGLPVITPTASGRGYDSFINRCIFTYNSKNDFISAVTKANKCKMTKNEIINEYFDYFSFTSGIKRLNNILSKL